MLNFSMPGRQNGKVMEVDFFNWGREKLSEIEIANREKIWDNNKHMQAAQSRREEE